MNDSVLSRQEKTIKALKSEISELEAHLSAAISCIDEIGGCVDFVYEDGEYVAQ